MKKLAAVFAAAVMAVTIAACANGQTENSDNGEKAVIAQSF